MNNVGAGYGAQGIGTGALGGGGIVPAGAGPGKLIFYLFLYNTKSP